MAQAEQWQQWLDDHGPALLLLARQMGLSLADGEDVVQEAFLRFWRSRGQARDEAAYLFACVRRCALEFLRGAGRRSSREKAVAREECCDGLLAAAPEREERRQAIEAVLSQLPQEQREVLVMKIWGKLSFEQLGEALAISPNTAASRYRYALAKLRQELCEEKVL